MMAAAERRNRIASLAVIAFGTILMAAGFVPREKLTAIGTRLGHGDDVTAPRVARYRAACWAVGVLLAGAGFASATVAQRSVAGFLRDLYGECRGWRVGSHARRAAALVRAGGLLYSAAFVVVLLSGVVLRFPLLFRPMLYDEAYSFLNFARRPLYEAVFDYNNTNNHLLNTALMHGMYRIAGQTDWALRLPAFLAGVLVIPASYSFARKTLGSAAALVGTALVATSPMLINYSAEARGYMMVTVCSLWMADRLAAALATRRCMDWMLAALAAAAGFYAMPIMLFAFSGCVLWGLWAAGRAGPMPWRRRGAVVLWGLFVLLVVGLLYLPTLVYSGLTAYDNPFVRPLSLSRWSHAFLPAWGQAVLHWSSVPLWAPRGPVALVVMVLAVVGLTAFVFERRERDGNETDSGTGRASAAGAAPGARWLLAALPLGAVLCMMLQRLAPPPRVFVVLAPYWLLLAGNGVAVLLRGARTWAQARPDAVAAVLAVGIVAGAALFAVTHNEPYLPAQKGYSRDVPTVARLLRHEYTPGDRVLVVVPYDKPLEYYLVKNEVAVPEQLALGGVPQVGERVWLVKPASLSRRDALRQIPGPRIASYEDLDTVVGQFTDWRYVSGVGHLQIWSAQVLPHAVARLGR